MLDYITSIIYKSKPNKPSGSVTQVPFIFSAMAQVHLSLQISAESFYLIMKYFSHEGRGLFQDDSPTLGLSQQFNEDENIINYILHYVLQSPDFNLYRRFSKHV